MLIGLGGVGREIMRGVITVTLKEYKESRMKDPAFSQAYTEIQPEMNRIRAMIDTQTSQNMMPKEQPEKAGISQTKISKMERGTRVYA